MIRVHPITRENVDSLKAVYNRFSLKAKPEYRWAHDPVDFEVFKIAVGNRTIRGYTIEETALAEPVGFMLYCLEEHRAIEINAIYCELEDRKTVIDRLMRRFNEDVRSIEGWDVISYAMLGDQEHYIRTICWYGFKPVGQAILKFDLMDTVSVQIMKLQKFDELPPGYRLESWQPEYAGGVAECLFESFADAADAKWDPRFRSLMGAKRVVATVTGGIMGTHFGSCTSVLFKGDTPVGFCFLIQSEGLGANIPLIGVLPSEKGKGFGNRLLHRTLDTCIQEMIDGNIAVLSVNTTTDTENLAAVKMYRRMGFREDYNYPHVYLPHEQLKVLKVGQWC